MELKHYEILSKVDTSKLTEEKNRLTYLTWSLAFDELLKKYPDVTYEIVKYDGKPYFIDESGAMVYTNMTIEGITREMWLPVLDCYNKPLKKDKITMFDINKAIMRCLVKNIAMFGLGLNIYAGEDLPLGDENIPKEDKKSHQEQINISQTHTNPHEEEFKKDLGIKDVCNKCGADLAWSEKAQKHYCSKKCWLNK